MKERRTVKISMQSPDLKSKFFSMHLLSKCRKKTELHTNKMQKSNNGNVHDKSQNNPIDIPVRENGF